MPIPFIWKFLRSTCTFVLNLQTMILLTNKNKNQLILEVISYLLIFLFVYTAYSKLTDLKAFEAVIGQSPFIKRNSVFISILVPIMELVVSCMLLFNSSRMYGLWFSLLLLVVFTGYILYMILYMPNLPCSCGGVITRLGWKGHVIFNLISISFTLTAIYLESCFISGNKRISWIRYKH